MKKRTGMILMGLGVLFLVAPLAGPIGAVIGFSFLSTEPYPLSLLMLFCSGGILYLIFQDIAPAAKLERHYFPPVGAVTGFLMGMIGTMLIQH